MMAALGKDERDELTAALAIALIIAIASLLAGCAHYERKPDHRPDRPAKIEAHLTAMPPITIAGRLVTLHAWLDDPEATVRCPGITWTWPNGTHSSHTADCDPEERITRHSEIKFGRMPQGDHQFRVTFDSAGHEWTAETTVEVH
jgi:hypothetical protein